MQCFLASSPILHHVTYSTLPSSTLHSFYKLHFVSFLADIIHISDHGIQPLYDISICGVDDYQTLCQFFESL